MLYMAVSETINVDHHREWRSCWTRSSLHDCLWPKLIVSKAVQLLDLCKACMCNLWLLAPLKLPLFKYVYLLLGLIASFSASNSAYSYTFLRSVVCCLSVVCYIHAPVLHPALTVRWIWIPFGRYTCSGPVQWRSINRLTAPPSATAQPAILSSRDRSIADYS